MVVRTKQLALSAIPIVVPSSFGDLYTCPAGKTAIIKSFTVLAQAITNVWVILSVRNVTTGALGFFFEDKLMATGDFAHGHGLFLVLDPGDTVRWSTVGGSAPGVVNLGVFGAELAGVAT